MNPHYVRYDVSDMEPAQLAALGDLLERRRVPHAIDRGVLLAFASDEPRVDTAIAEVERTTCSMC